MYGERIFTFDAATVAFKDDAEGIVVDAEGDVQFDWDSVEVVRLDDVPWADAFETREFYKLPATVARPVKQTYLMGDKEVTLMKPREELKKAAWSLHNAPWTLGHPDTRMVKSTDDIHGFWRDPRYIDALDSLDADLYIPIEDTDAKEYVEKYDDVSVGFYNVLTPVTDYDGVVGSADSTDVEGYQTEMYFDHCASVPAGRCNSEQGCGVHKDNSKGFINLTNTTELSDSYMEVDASKFVNPDDDQWYAVPPEDNSEDKWKFPINNCSDVEDAWKLRKHGDISISVDTLESRIKSRADDLNCEVPEGDTDSFTVIDGGTHPFYTNLHKTMTDDNGGDGTTDAQFVADMAVDAIAAKNDGVQALVDEVENLKDKLSLKDEKLEELNDKVDEYESAEKQELVDHITKRTEVFGTADELMELDVEALREKKDLVDELSADEKTANGGGEETVEPVVTRQRATPWD